MKAVLALLAVLYFDAHNHFTGILPFQAYANLPAYVAHFANPHAGPALDDRRALLRYLETVWYPQQGAALGDRPSSPPDGQRFALGARATLVVFRNRTDVRDVDGALERILSATPWSEFDSAYAFRGGPASDYLRTRFYHGDEARLAADLCRATVLDLAATNIDASEQSLPFAGGFHFENGRSDRLDTIQCPQRAASDPRVVAGLRRIGKPMPVIRFVLMTLTAQLATLPGGTTYSEWSKTGTCAAVPLPKAIETSPETIYSSLMGLKGDGRPAVARGERFQYWTSVVGIDTAGPETTCFSGDGMTYFSHLADAVYRAAKDRRALGWRGKLLVHTHVGEGSAIDYVPAAPLQPWTFGDAFAHLPSQLTNTQQAGENISALLGAIARFRQAHPDADRYVIFRLAHVTWANAAQAQTMHGERVEADVNLESNVATGAYPISRMPLGRPLIMRLWIDPIAGNPAENFELNDLLGALVSSPSNVNQTGSILGDAALRYLLEYHVRCLLGTDADGVEHSDIVREYAYAASLISYWDATDEGFRSLASGVREQTLFDNVAWHQANMTADEAEPY
ncbi:MAG TPA: hypothetical protein VFE36_01840 [Candidatus Baltobacteraceae bacterium]|jgi:hypothetical protein|nr:hypothetical protein [Candidatus Baltobacteraceae bacterium]